MNQYDKSACDVVKAAEQYKPLFHRANNGQSSNFPSELFLLSRHVFELGPCLSPYVYMEVLCMEKQLIAVNSASHISISNAGSSNMRCYFLQNGNLCMTGRHSQSYLRHPECHIYSLAWGAPLVLYPV